MSIETIKLIISIISFCYAVIQTVIVVRNSIKTKNFTKLKVMLTEEIIPLMEQAENFDNEDNFRENWVVKKLSEKLHIDFYKYKDILQLVKTIISDICKQTKIAVNNNQKVVIQNIEKKEDEDNGIY